MAERVEQVRLRVHLDCDECGEEMQFIGMVLGLFPPFYVHKCSNGHSCEVKTCYPVVRHVPVTDTVSLSVTGEATSSPLRDRLIDYLDDLYFPPTAPVDDEVTIAAQDMADALLPFIRAELASQPPTQYAYDAACKALWKHRTAAVKLRATLYALVRLKDGPRDETYRALKEGAWQRAREVLANGD